VPALVAGDLDVIDPYRGAVIDSPEMQQKTLSRRRIESAPVPDHVAWLLADP